MIGTNQNWIVLIGRNSSFCYVDFFYLQTVHSTYSVQQRVLNIECLERTKLSCGRMIRLHAHPLPPFPVSNFSVFLSLPVCRRSSLLTREGGGDGRGAKSYGREKAWSSINHSVLSVTRWKGGVGYTLFEFRFRRKNWSRICVWRRFIRATSRPLQKFTKVHMHKCFCPENLFYLFMLGVSIVWKINLEPLVLY
jgi:hypothetical protein